MAYRVFANTKNMSREDWLEARKAGLGGSDAAAILGLSTYASPFSVWCDKTGVSSGGESETEVTWRGNVLEEPIARRFTKESGLDVIRCNMMLQSVDHPFMLANIDRRVKGKRIGVEIKSVSNHTKTDFENGEIDPRFYCQCMHYLAVTGWEKWILVVWVVDKGLYTFEIYPDETEITALIDAESRFWRDHVETGVMPPADASSSCAESLLKAFPSSNGNTIYLDCSESVAEYLRLTEAIKSLEKERDAIKHTIQKDMGANETAETDGFVVNWKSGKPSTKFDAKRLASEAPDIYKRYLVSTEPVRRFTIQKAGASI